jgi:hypothetical protein
MFYISFSKCAIKLVSNNVVGLYQNIPHEEGIETMRTELNKRTDKSVPTELLVELLTHARTKHF